MPERGDTRPSLSSLTLFAVGWHACTWLGLLVVFLSARQLSPPALSAMSPALLMIAALVVLSELRPVVMTRLIGNPVSFSAAFVFATLYMWGMAPAAVLFAGSVVMSELLRRKALWKLVFNVGQYSLSLLAAWLVMLAAGVHPTPFDPQRTLAAHDVPWIVASWMAYHVVNLALVATLAASDDQTWWESFSEEFWFYTSSAMAVLALSPMVLMVCEASPGSWALLPLLILPLLAVQKTAQMSREKEHMSMHDPLTGLPNRLLLSDRIEQALANRPRIPGDVVVLFLDIDSFKLVNDSLGHEAGDTLLIELSQRLAGVLRPGDTLARFSSDEFVLVCGGMSDRDVDTMVADIHACLAEPFRLVGREVEVTVSIGVAVAGPGTDEQTLLRDADAAVYRAKEAGRSRTIRFDDSMHAQVRQRLDVEAGLRRALNQGELVVHYQPVMNLATRHPAGVEALVRWANPQRGLLGPDVFIPVAEDTGLIVPLGAFVLTEAMGQVRRWRDCVPGAAHLYMAVNISARQLSTVDLCRTVADALDASGLPPSAVSLELTESVIMSQVGHARRALEQLRELGVGLAIDDFGTGYSSLSYLKQLPVTSLKIDRSFVDGLGAHNAHDVSIVAAITGMANALDLEVVAEGVESEEQLRDLSRLGVHLAQGFLWSTPLSAADLEAWLRERASTALAGG